MAFDWFNVGGRTMSIRSLFNVSHPHYLIPSFTPVFKLLRVMIFSPRTGRQKLKQTCEMCQTVTKNAETECPIMITL